MVLAVLLQMIFVDVRLFAMSQILLDRGYQSQRLWIEQAPAKVYLVEPQKSFFKDEMVLSLIAVFLGFVMGLLGSLINKHYERHILRKAIIKYLFDEIFELRAGMSRSETFKGILKKFKKISGSSPRPTKGPSVAHFNLSRNEFYKLYNKDLWILSDKLRERIVYFYNLHKSIDANSEKLERYFSDYYAGKETIGPLDIERYLQRLIDQLEKAYWVGAEILALIIHEYGYTGRLPPLPERDLIDYRKKLKLLIEEREPGNILALEYISKELGLEQILSCVLVIQEPCLDFARVNYGEYKVL